MIGWLRWALLPLLWCARSCVLAQNGTYVSNERRLYHQLMNDYVPNVRPVASENDSVAVKFDFYIRSFDYLDEKSQSISLSGWLHQSWKDVGLTWEPSAFGGVTRTHIKASELWLPDITLVSSKYSYVSIPTDHNAMISYTGKVRWVAPVNLYNLCDIDLTYFPFDEHTCNVVFLSWSFDTTKLNISIFEYSSASVSIHPDQSSTEWEVTSAYLRLNEYFYHGYNSSFQDVTYYITVKRRSNFAAHMFVAPSVVFCLLTPAVFLLPPGTVEKMMLGIGLLLSNLLLLLQLIDFIPTAHHTLPYMAKYLLGNIIMSAISLLISTVIVGFWSRSNTSPTPPPAFLRLFIQSPVSTVFCVSKDDFIAMEDIEASSGSSANSHQQEGGGANPTSEPSMEEKSRQINAHLWAEARAAWRQLAIVFDRFFFVVYCIVLAALTLAFAQYL